MPGRSTLAGLLFMALCSWTPPPVPLWKQLPTDKSWTILTVYKSGFVLPEGTPPITVGANFNGIVKMQRFKQSFEAQLQVMHEAELASRCNTAQSYVAQRPLLSQLAADAAAVARTPEQLETAQREFDFRANDDDFNQAVHPDAHHDSPPPPPPPCCKDGK